MEGIGIQHLSLIRQMSPYGGPSRRYFTDTKGQSSHLGFGGKQSVPVAITAVCADAALRKLGEDYDDVLEGFQSGSCPYLRNGKDHICQKKTQ